MLFQRLFLANGHQHFGAATVYATLTCLKESFAEFHVHLEAWQRSLPVSLFFNYRAKGAFSKYYLTTVSTATIIQHLGGVIMEHRCNDTATENDTHRRKEAPGGNPVPVPHHSP